MANHREKADSSIHRSVDDVLEAFEDAWEAGLQPSIDTCLPADGEDRLDILFELIHVDLERRIRAGITTQTEDYLHRFPELDRAPDRLVEVIVTETRLRRRRGESIGPAEIEARFPLLVEQLRQQIAIEPESVADKLAPQFVEHGSLKTGIRLPDTAASLADGSFPVVGGYTLREVLGKGGAAVVYLADQHSPYRQVAIKMLHGASGQLQELAHRLQAEAEALAQLQHPHIVQVFEVGQYQGQPFLVMEYLSGGSLHDHLAERPLDSQEAALLVKTLATATEAAHNHGIIHRDLKPSNVLFGTAGNCKITDFGLAKQLDTDQLLTQTGEILGTPSFMAPEQALAAHGDVGRHTDVYALGAILYAGLTGMPVSA